MDPSETSLDRLTEQERRRLGEKLRQARDHAGWTQSEAALRLGVTQATISRFETGERGMELAEMLVLARFYGVAPAWFLE